MVMEAMYKKLTENLDSPLALERQERQVSNAAIKNHPKNVTV